MPVVVEKLSSNFTILPNCLLRNGNLNADERSVLLYCLSQSSTWNFKSSIIAADLHMSKNRVLKAINGLIESGFASRYQKRKSGEKFGEIVYTFYSSPKVVEIDEADDNQDRLNGAVEGDAIFTKADSSLKTGEIEQMHPVQKVIASSKMASVVDKIMSKYE